MRALASIAALFAWTLGYPAAWSTGPDHIAPAAIVVYAIGVVTLTALMAREVVGK